MDYINENRNNGKHNVLVLNTRDLDIELNYITNNKKILTSNVTVNIDNQHNNNYEINSAYLCENFLGNKSVHHLLINMIEVNNTPSKNPVPVILPRKVKLGLNDFIQTTIIKYSKEQDVISGCYDPFGSHKNPEVEQGNVILGTP
ncbi:hypothetical protein [Polaribacter porphyrae]|uniref:Uncharacterized protein n=1 Tax=Polaribacter porphyrae TaxID=1137780 RepID=A0A2S7WJM8_9FLAO|nr:hypothetical protein [Polaribacter porphyrae]PQJ77817.1 hypothetical protein BTO18_00845 [Polaribacter porphyrae]